MNFNNILSQIIEVDSKGFDATTGSYFNYIDTGGIDNPPSGNSGSNKIKGAKNLTPEEQADYIDAWRRFPKEQAKVARYFQEKYPEINVDSLYSSLKETGFTNSKSGEVAAELRRKFGEKYVDVEEVDSISDSYYTLANKLKYYDAKESGKNYFDSTGSLEGNVTKDRFGYENLIQTRFTDGEKYGEYSKLLREEIDKKKAERKSK